MEQGSVTRHGVTERDDASPRVMCVYSVKMFTILESTVTGKTYGAKSGP